MNFIYEHLDAKLASKTDREELHGDEGRPGCTLKLVMECENRVLDLLAPGLRVALYTTDDEGKNPELDLDAEHLPSLRFAHMGVIPWGNTCTDHRVTILGPGGRNPIALLGCEIKAFKVDCRQGGTVVLSVNVNCHPSNTDAGKLYSMLGSHCEVTFEPDPGAPEQKDLTDGDDSGGE